MRMKFFKLSCWSGNLSRWVAVSLVLLSMILTACGSNPPTNPITCAQAASTAQNTPTSSTHTMCFWRSGVIAIGLNLNNSPQVPGAAAIANCINKGDVGANLLHDDTGMPAFIVLNQAAVLFLSVDDTRLVNAVNNINNIINNNSYTTKVINQCLSPITIVGASPDWLTITDSDDYIGGSPAGTPQPTGSQSCSSNSVASTPPGGSQDVYILDSLDSSPITLPSGWPANCDLRTLSASIVSNMRYSFTREMQQLGQNDPMFSTANKEHGLFDSALIHHLAPNAHIHLIQVLNDYGVGDMQSLLWGLSKIDNKSGAIVNMSLTVIPPLACVEDVWEHLSGWQGLTPTDFRAKLASCYKAVLSLSTPEPEPSKRESNDNDIRRLYAPLGNMIASLVGDGVHLVAAAGNDSAKDPTTGTDKPLPADAPAAYCGVISVAAATSKVGDNWKYNAQSSLAPFSNSPYPWPGQCLNPTAPFGQGSDQLHGIVAVGWDVCSLHLQMSNDLALWRGTSFATAIVSGNFAAGNLMVNGQQALVSAPGQSFSENQPCG